jgi:hypothetical protein
MDDHRLCRAAACLSAVAAIAVTGGVTDAEAKHSKCSYHEVQYSVFDGVVDGSGLCTETPTKGTLHGTDVSCVITVDGGENPTAVPLGTTGPPFVSFFRFGPELWRCGPTVTPLTDSCPDGEGRDRALTFYADEWIKTKKGTIHFHTYGISFGDLWLNTFYMRAQPETSTGDFAGVTGVLGGMFEWKNDPDMSFFSGNVRLTGYLCTP